MYHNQCAPFPCPIPWPSPQVSMQYNLCNEPWFKYTMCGIADRGLKHSQWTSARLSHDVLYVETHRCVPYALCPGRGARLFREGICSGAQPLPEAAGCTRLSQGLRR